MSALAWVCVLTATLVSGGAGLAAAAMVALLTKAPRLRYAAATAALVFAFAPLLMGVGFVGGHAPSELAPVTRALSAVTSWAPVEATPGESWTLARNAPVLLVVYVAGVAACLARLGWRCLALRQVLHAARAADPERLKGVHTTLPVRISDRTPSAILVGLRRPVVLLPAHALEDMSAAQLRWVLAHEETHACRRDNLRVLAEALLRAVIWFNPFVIIAAALAAEAREQLCDQSVLGAAADASQRRAYAETLLIALRLGSRIQVASMFIPNGKRSLSMRLKAIMNPVRPTPARATASLGAIAAAGLLTLTIGAATWAQTSPSLASPAKAAPQTLLISPHSHGLTMRLLDERGRTAPKSIVSGDMVVDAKAVVDQRGQSVVRFRLTSQGANQLAAATRDNVGRRLAILVDGKVLSAPRIRAEIKGGAGEISGHFTPAEAKSIAVTIAQGRAT